MNVLLVQIEIEAYLKRFLPFNCSRFFESNSSRPSGSNILWFKKWSKSFTQICLIISGDLTIKSGCVNWKTPKNLNENLVPSKKFFFGFSPDIWNLIIQFFDIIHYIHCAEKHGKTFPYYRNRYSWWNISFWPVV